MEEEFDYLPLKSQQRSIKFPDDLQLHLGSLEINFFMAAHESIISTFKLNKRYVEKELSNLFQQAKKLKKAGKDKVEVTIAGVDNLIAQA